MDEIDDPRAKPRRHNKLSPGLWMGLVFAVVVIGAIYIGTDVAPW